jgi:hypothetical protein
LTAFEEIHGQVGIDEINNICYSHVLTMEYDEAKKVRYCGADVVDGKLRIIFEEGEMGTNMYGALDGPPLEKALTEADPPAGTIMSYSARANIRLDYDAKISPIQEKIAAQLQNPDIILLPNFEDTFEKLMAESKRKKNTLSRTWQQELGDITRKYFDGIAFQLKKQKFGEDELLREGFQDMIDKGTIAFRIVDKLEYDSDCECKIENGVLYLQVCDPRRRPL